MFEILALPASGASLCGRRHTVRVDWFIQTGDLKTPCCCLWSTIFLLLWESSQWDARVWYLFSAFWLYFPTVVREESGSTNRKGVVSSCDFDETCVFRCTLVATLVRIVERLKLGNYSVIAKENAIMDCCWLKFC